MPKLGVRLRFGNILYFTRVSHQSEKWLDTVNVSFPFNHDCLVVMVPNSPPVGTSPAAMVGLVGAAAVVCMHEKSWIFAGSHQLRCDLVPPTACMVSCRRNTPGMVLCLLCHGWNLKHGWLYLRGTVKFAVSFSYKELRSYLLPRYGSYVVFHGCNLKLVLLGVVLHAWLR
ncbi:unnamed protein product [Sphenostylis stenocarpa]|uniref:Uncharacterized protein n=1 Tax=Sphenostylis stenocarpa TaxID=92480 RepID=A0AA86W4P8_9FABA|nr:unnamed protein product [Sphenostylis stenocarpa]